MKNKDGLLDELRELSPRLADRKKGGDGLGVPKDFFRALPDEVLGQIKLEERRSLSVQPSWSERLAAFLQGFWQPRYALAFAGVLAVVVAAVFLLKKEMTPEQAPLMVQNISLEEVPTEEILAYLSQNTSDLTLETLVEEQLSEPKSKPLHKVVPKPDVQEMQDYLEDDLENLDLEDLEDLL